VGALARDTNRQRKRGPVEPGRRVGQYRRPMAERPERKQAGPGRPPTIAGEVKKVNMWLDLETHTSLRAVAYNRSSNVSEEIRRILHDHFAKHPAPKAP